MHRAEQRLTRLLTALALVFFVSAAAYACAPLVAPLADSFRHLPFVSNSVVKVSLLGLLSLYAAADIRRRLGLVRILILAHVVSVAAMLILILAPAVTVGSTLTVGGVSVTTRTLLWAAVAVDAVIALLLLGFYGPARESSRTSPTSGTARGERLELCALDAPGRITRPEQRVKTLATAFGALFLLGAVGYELGPLFSATRDGFLHLPFVTNSVVKLTILGLLCFHTVSELRLRQSLLGIVVAAHGISALTMLMYLGSSTDTSALLSIGSRDWPVSSILWTATILDGAIGLVLFAFYQAAWSARYGENRIRHTGEDTPPRLMRPIEYRTLIALADVLVMGDAEQISPIQVAENVETYVGPIRARRRWVYRVALFAIYFHPLLYLKAPLPELAVERRLDHIKKHFQQSGSQSLRPNALRRFVRAAIRIGKQLTYVGYYNDERTFASVGYVPFSKRRPAAQKSQVQLQVMLPKDVEGSTLPGARRNICIIGSGAAGAIMAYRLAERTSGTNTRILVVERGKYVRPRDFTENEVDMMGVLYADGLFQQTTDFNFTILQGSCVGGSTVVNNAVCFDPPDAVLDKWNDEYQAGLCRSTLQQSVQSIRTLLDIQRQKNGHLNPSAKRFVDAAVRYSGSRLPPRELDVRAVEANIEDCLGCGYCNIGCAYGKKLSMLDRVLPRAQSEFGDRVEILAECTIERLCTRSGHPLKISSAVGVLSDGRRVTIEADTFVLAAGAVASPYLLLRSGLGVDLPVGRRMSFNMGSPITAEFDDEMDAYRGLQISHAGLPATDRGFVIETWWNPPVAQAVNMPGWFEDHFDNMRNYRRLMAVGVLVGTEATGRVRPALTGGPDVVYRPSARDLRKLGDGLALTSEILFEAGAKRIMVNTWGYDVLTHPNQIPDIYRIVSDPSYVTLGTGHPQGGNALSNDPAIGVVGDDFRVHGYGNLYVCDASVFPSSVTVNPQLTVMALADYASQLITLGR